jgi:hypothetical protein
MADEMGQKGRKSDENRRINEGHRCYIDENGEICMI